MKITVKEKPESKNEFPKLMIEKNFPTPCIVLFEDQKRGTILKGSDSTLGIYFQCLDINNFEDFHGEITLSND